MQPQLTALPYRPDALLDYFTTLAGQPWTMLLHSGNSDHPDSRYDIMVAAPAVTLVTRDGITEIRREDDREIRYDDPFTLVQQQLAAAGMAAPCQTRHCRSREGALGYFGYDLARGIETLPELAQQDVPLPEMTVGIYRWTVIADHHHHIVTLVSYDDPAPLLTKLTAAPPTSTPFHLLGPWRANMTSAEYGEKFRQVQQHLLGGGAAIKSV